MPMQAVGLGSPPVVGSRGSTDVHALGLGIAWGEPWLSERNAVPEHAIRRSAAGGFGSRGRSAELPVALAVHLLMLPVYYFWAWVGAYWSRAGRVQLVSRVFAWALASSVTVLVVVPLLWRPTRALLVPPSGVEG